MPKRRASASVSSRVLQAERLDRRDLMAIDLVDIGQACVEWRSFESPTAAVSLAAPAKAKPTYTYSILGDSANSPALPTPGLALIGGGTDIDAAFAWMGQRANGGDFVVLSAGKNSYARYINGLSSLNSVESLVIPDRAAAQDDFVANIVAAAEAIFITGGDQSNYINNWSGTKLELAIYTALSRGGVLGGTSAGLAVLGDVDYAALNDSTSSADALANPLLSSITLDSGFVTPDEVAATPLQFLQETITDSHFMQRDRMGRSLAFLARADYEGFIDPLPGDPLNTFPRGIAINEQTALLIEGSGLARVVGNPYAKKGTHYDQQRSVYMMSATVDAMLTGGPLNYQVEIQRLTFDPISGVGDLFDLATWSSATDDFYTVTAVAGVLDATLPDNSDVGIYGPMIA